MCITENNPIKYTDPDGKTPSIIRRCFIGGFSGAVSGVFSR